MVYHKCASTSFRHVIVLKEVVLPITYDHSLAPHYWVEHVCRRWLLIAMMYGSTLRSLWRMTRFSVTTWLFWIMNFIHPSIFWKIFFHYILLLSSMGTEEAGWGITNVCIRVHFRNRCMLSKIFFIISQKPERVHINDGHRAHDICIDIEHIYSNKV